MLVARRSSVVATAFVLVAAACGTASTAPTAIGDDGGVGDDAQSEAAEASVDAGADDGAPGACDLPGVYGSKECMACVAAKCCALVHACEQDASCKKLQKCNLDCLSKPDAGGCLGGCLAAFPDARPLWDPVDRCWFGTPPAGCLVECTN